MSYIRRIITGLVKLMGIYPIREDRPRFSKIYRTFILSWLFVIAIVPSTSVFLYKPEDDIFLAVTTTAYSIDVVQTFICWYIYVRKLDTVNDFLENCDRFYSKRDNEHYSVGSSKFTTIYDENKFRKPFNRVAAFICVSYTFALMAPILQMLQGKKKTLDMIMFPLIIPGLKNTIHAYLVLYILESLLEIIVLVNHCLTITHVLFATIWFKDRSLDNSICTFYAFLRWKKFG